MWSRCACVMTTASTDRGSTGNGAQFLARKSLVPWNRPQSNRHRRSARLQQKPASGYRLGAAEEPNGGWPSALGSILSIRSVVSAWSIVSDKSIVLAVCRCSGLRLRVHNASVADSRSPSRGQTAITLGTLCPFRCAAWQTRGQAQSGPYFSLAACAACCCVNANQAPRRVPDSYCAGADDRIRTGDPHLGKVMLYQLSHVRNGRLTLARHFDGHCHTRSCRKASLKPDFAAPRHVRGTHAGCLNAANVSGGRDIGTEAEVFPRIDHADVTVGTMDHRCAAPSTCLPETSHELPRSGERRR